MAGKEDYLVAQNVKGVGFFHPYDHFELGHGDRSDKAEGKFECPSEAPLPMIEAMTVDEIVRWHGEAAAIVRAKAGQVEL